MSTVKFPGQEALLVFPINPPGESRLKQLARNMLGARVRKDDWELNFRGLFN